MTYIPERLRQQVTERPFTPERTGRPVAIRALSTYDRGTRMTVMARTADILYTLACRYRRYDDYRDSGVEWLGEFPAHWEIRRLKFLANDINQQRVEVGENEVYLQLENIESWTSKYAIAEDTVSNFERSVKAFQPEDVLFGKLRPYLAKVVVSRHYGVCVGELLVLRVRENTILPKFLALRLLTKEIIDVINASTYGAKMPRANWGFIGNLEIPFPPDPDEQRAIAAFLDRQTAKIDALIAKKRELIAALHEQRSAIISHAVTKGLNPDAPLKDSGIEWLGEIPAGWEVVKIKHLALVGNGSTPLRDNEEYWYEGTFPWITSTVVNDDVVEQPTQFVTKRALRECHLPIVPPNSVLVAITGQGKTRGMAALLRYEATINQHLVYIAPRSNSLSPEFLQRFLSSMYDIFRMMSEGAGSTRGALTVEQIANFSESRI
jgi:type I restriction enzyme S subunit